METLIDEKRLQISRGVRMRISAPGQFVAIQERTARQYAVGQKIVDLLKALQIPQTVPEIKAGILASCSDQEVTQVLDFLQRHQLINPETDEPLYQIRQPAYTLFGLEGIELEKVKPNWHISVGMSIWFGIRPG